MAFAISSGMTPQAGIYCAIVTGFVISALGGSYVQIGGPTGAFVVVVSGIIAEHGLDGLFMCTMMAGVVLVVMGLTGSGTAVRFIPRPVVIGFTNGIALVIASTQLRDVLGITLDGPVPGEFIGRMRVLLENVGNASIPTTVVGIGVLVLIIVWNRLVPRVPGYIVALVGGTIVVAAAGLPLETIGSQVRRHSGRIAAPAVSALSSRSDSVAAVADAHRRDARRHRIAAVGGRRRSDERPPAQLERGALRAGDRQHRVADGRRLAGDRSHRTHRDQRALGRPDAGRRDDSCAARCW